jgi:serine protease Do
MRRSAPVWLLVLASLATAHCSREEAPQESAPAPPPALPLKAPPGSEATLAPLLERVSPSVVSVAVSGKQAIEQNPMLQDPLLRRFFGIPPGPTEREFQHAGSGVIVDSEKGYVLTNHHVIDHADRITAVLPDGRRLTAKLVGTDPQSDVAVIQIPADHLTGLAMGDSDKVQVGDFVVAIGNPFGLSGTATFGIVSAIGRSGLGIEGYEDFIQTDASINPGNSGGPLVDLTGEVIGINAAIVGPAGGNVGIGFAIPINMAREVMDQLVRYGEVHRGQLGIMAQDLTPDLAQALGIEATGGALVTKVIDGSPAADAGIERRDVIVSIDGTPVRNASDLRNKIALHQPGETAKLELLRDSARQSVEVEIGSPAQPKVEAQALTPRLRGVQLGEIAPGSAAYGRVAGVAVLGVEPGSPAWEAGLRPGDIITSVDRQLVGSVEQLQRALSGRSDGILLHVVRGDTALFIYIS